MAMTEMPVPPWAGMIAPLDPFLAQDDHGFGRRRLVIGHLDQMPINSKLAGAELMRSIP